MYRWTMKQLEETDDITFAIAILNERREGTICRYSPLSVKLSEAAHTLALLKEQQDRDHSQEGRE